MFSGIGGLDIGARAAGLKVAAATDQDENALALLGSTLRVPTVPGAIETIEPADLLAAGAIEARDVRYLIGGPPCTAFSHAGFWLSDKRAGLDPAAARLDDYLNFVKSVRPRAFLLENVPGLAFTTHRAVLERLINRARRAGYAVSARIVSAKDFGVAQARRRLLVIGVRGGPAFDFGRLPRLPQRSSSWALAGVTRAVAPAEPDEKIGGRYGQLLRLVPPGGNYLHFTDRRGWSPPEFKYRGRYWSFLLKLDPKAPAPTLPAQRVTYNGPFHWRNRHLRAREIARLQAFPDSLPLGESLAAARRYLGNAVPPLLAAVVLWQLRVQLGEADATRRPAFLELAADPQASAAQVFAALEARPLQARRAA